MVVNINKVVVIKPKIGKILLLISAADKVGSI
jgi:hypothetical protein